MVGVKQAFKNYPKLFEIGFEKELTRPKVLKGVKPTHKIKLFGETYEIYVLNDKDVYIKLRQYWRDKKGKIHTKSYLKITNILNLFNVYPTTILMMYVEYYALYYYDAEVSWLSDLIYELKKLLDKQN